MGTEQQVEQEQENMFGIKNYTPKDVPTTKSKTVLVTGTEAGFGRRMVETLSGAGHTVVAAMREIKGINATAASELRELPNVVVIGLDASADDAKIESALHAAAAAAGSPIDVLLLMSATGKIGQSSDELMAYFDER